MFSAALGLKALQDPVLQPLHERAELGREPWCRPLGRDLGREGHAPDLAASFPIQVGDCSAAYPDVAFNGSDRYLVAWNASTGPGEQAIQGCVVDTSGTITSAESRYDSMLGGTYRPAPRIAANAELQDFVVCWAESKYQQPTPGPGGVISLEPDRLIDIQKNFYLLPIIDYVDPYAALVDFYDGGTLGLLDSFFAFSAAFTDGVFVAGG